MIGERNYLKNIKPYFNIYVSFGGGDKGKIIGNGRLDYRGLHCLNDVLLFNGLNDSLTNIIQLCNQYLSVKCNREECIVIDK